MNKVVIVSACRTPIGVMGGALSTVSASELGAVVIKEAVRRAGIEPSAVEEVFFGNALQAGGGPNVARQAAIGAGLPVETTATTINILCASGLQSVNLAAKEIAGGFADVIVAGGTENMSMAPYLVMKGRFGYRMGNATLEDSMLHDALVDPFYNYHMGVTAENVAEQWGITREQLDEFALCSQQKAAAAQENGGFDEEIVPVEVKGKKGSVMVTKDEGPRPQTTPEGLAKLRPAFIKDGKVTAGNASGINDGAAALVLMSEEKAKELGVEPMAYWCGGDLGGVDPSIMGVGPIYATQKVMKRLGLSIDDFDLYEANEAFAAQSLAVARDLHFDPEKLNVKGGAIALGHPLGCSGARILTTLLYAMKERKAGRGLATLCIGGGMGCATVVEMPWNK